MLPRERVFRTLDFKAPDILPVEFHPSAAGMNEHGEKLRDLFARFGQDFGDPREFRLARADPRDVGPDGRYLRREQDFWGVEWEYKFFGIAGHPVRRPLDDWANWDNWVRQHPPEPPPLSEAERARTHAAAQRHMQTYFLKNGWGSILEAMAAVRRFEDVLIDLETDAPEIHRLADHFLAFQLKQIDFLLARGVDAVQLADDFGTQEALLLSPKIWRRFFRPRYAEMIKPIKKAGKLVFFHSCGQVAGLLDDLAELGVNAIWPQLPLYDAGALAAACRRNRVACALQLDRSHLMTYGTPAQVREAVQRSAREFRVEEGGFWYYVEIDNGFPWENVRALVETIGELRGNC